MLVFINGEYFPEKEAKISVFDRGFLYGDGVFETIAAVNGNIYWLNKHVDRLLEGAKYLKIDSPYEKAEIMHHSQEMYKMNYPDFPRNCKIKVILTRGVSEDYPNIEKIDKCKPNLIMYCSELRFPKKLREEGMKLVTTKETRSYPTIKSMSYLVSVFEHIRAKEKGFDDALFVEDGNILEGTNFNIFMIKDNALYTPSENILEGVTAGKVLKIAEDFGLKTCKGNISLDDIDIAQEMLISGTTKRVLPVVQIDNKQIRDSKVGFRTKKLMDKFSELYY